MTAPHRDEGSRTKGMQVERKPYEAIQVRRLTPLIGAEISGVDLSGPLGNQAFDEIHRALMEHLVIFFRDQTLTPQQHLDFGSRFGELHVHPIAPHEPGLPALMRVYTDEKSARINGEHWHTDVSCEDEPPMGSILYLRQCPPEGGDTLFANMYAAYEALSDRMKAHLEGLTALHDGEQVYRGAYANFGVADKASYPRSEHPVVRTHPVTGAKSLLLSAHIGAIVGWPRPEAMAFIRDLMEHATQEAFVYAHRWTAHDLVIWDNRATMHRVRRFDDMAITRDLRRTTTRCEEPTVAQQAA